MKGGQGASGAICKGKRSDYDYGEEEEESEGVCTVVGSSGQCPRSPTENCVRAVLEIASGGPAFSTRASS